jgi:hypothetical protein
VNDTERNKLDRGPPNKALHLTGPAFRFFETPSSMQAARQVNAVVSPLHEDVMRPLRYSINVTLDGCCDHRAIPADEELHRHHAENLAQADVLIFGRVTYEMMEAAWRPPARTGVRPDWMADWMEPFARTIDTATDRFGRPAERCAISGDVCESVFGVVRLCGTARDAAERLGARRRTPSLSIANCGVARSRGR